jgi:hypothetical protein
MEATKPVLCPLLFALCSLLFVTLVKVKPWLAAHFDRASGALGSGLGKSFFSDRVEAGFFS